jgi:pyridoxamine 5'-phosphate oxidase
VGDGAAVTDPIAQFRDWFESAREAGVRFPETMTLATVSADGAPSARMVLLKGVDEDGFVFFTGYESRKGGELAENPRAALVFYWQPLGRQVRVEGTVERVAAAESDEYFASRPRGSQLAAWASEQSRPLASREALEQRYAELEAEHEGRDVPRPDRWGGYRLRPEAIEFWQHRDNRLHERVRHTRARESWVSDLLSP